MGGARDYGGSRGRCEEGHGAEFLHDASEKDKSLVSSSRLRRRCHKTSLRVWLPLSLYA